MNSKNDGKPVNRAEVEGAEPWLGSGWSLAVIVATEVAIGTLLLRLGLPQAPIQAQTQPPVAVASALPKHGEKAPTNDLDRVVQWARLGDAGGRGFVVVDKPHARVIAFDAQGRMTHSVPALLGAAKGDDSVPGIGEKPVPQVLPEERITPAGRFVAQLGNNLTGEDIVWIDYDAAVSMHRVRATNPKEKRLERLASESIDDNRISYGCINLPVAFFEGVLRPLVQAGPTVVYVLPDQRPLTQVFAFSTQ